MSVKDEVLKNLETNLTDLADKFGDYVENELLSKKIDPDFLSDDPEEVEKEGSDEVESSEDATEQEDVDNTDDEADKE